MPDIPWLRVDEEILRLRAIAALEWAHCVNPGHPQWEDSAHTPFTNALRYEMVTRAPVHLRSSVVALLLVPDLRVGDTAVQLNELNAIDLSGTQRVRSQVSVLNHRGQGEHSYCNGEHGQCNFYNGWLVMSNTGKAIFMVA